MRALLWAGLLAVSFPTGRAPPLAAPIDDPVMTIAHDKNTDGGKKKKDDEEKEEDFACLLRASSPTS